MNVLSNIVALAEREVALARAGEWEALTDISAERGRLTAALSALPSPAARPALERLAALNAELIELLRAARDGAGAELARLRHGRAAVRGYGAA